MVGQSPRRLSRMVAGLAGDDESHLRSMTAEAQTVAGNLPKVPRQSACLQIVAVPAESREHGGKGWLCA